MAACAPDSAEGMEMCEDCISSVTEVLRVGRRGCAREFYTTGDLNVELEETSRSSMRCTGLCAGQGMAKTVVVLRN